MNTLKIKLEKCIKTPKWVILEPELIELIEAIVLTLSHAIDEIGDINKKLDELNNAIKAKK